MKLSMAATALLGLLTQINLMAQDRGILTGSFETNSIYYVKDNATSASVPSEGYGSNNYLKLDWGKGGWGAGIQAEWFPVPLQGYRQELKGFGLPEKYVSWKGKGLKVTIGDFYDQFGSGLLFRSWEDRTLGMNNSIGGARIEYADDLFSAKLIYGLPRDYVHSTKRGYKWYVPLYDNYAESSIAGGDFSLAIDKLLGLETVDILTLEGSLLERIENSLPELMKEEVSGLSVPENNLSWSARMNYYQGHFSFKGEYVWKQKDYYESLVSTKPELKAGSAVLTEMTYSLNDFSVSASFRRTENVVNKAYRSQETLESNTLNYVPALCRQHVYMLCTLDPYYSPAEGEIGGQADAFYNFRPKTVVGGRYGMRVHVNHSSWHTLKSNHPSDKNALMFRDFSLDIDKRWSNRFKTILYLNIQKHSPSHEVDKMTETRNIAILDARYKISKSISIRTELQYLYSAKGDGDWMAGLVEFNFAPQWSIVASDMYNHDGTKIHYCQGGVSYSKGALRIAASYGRNREGMICSGGVCRWQPAFTGGSLSATVVF